MRKLKKLGTWSRTFLLLSVLCFFAVLAQAQTVKGIVRDQNGEAIIGATVKVLGGKGGAVTDSKGQYSIEAPSGSILTVSYIGYLTKQIRLRGENTVDVVLMEDNTTLKDVVVIGYGTQRKESVTGSVASMKGDVLRDVPTGDVTSALQGRIAGVQMTQTSSKPGASQQIRIRGTRSLSASNDPLIVLDGIPFAGSISDIDPGSIKSMDILKDASATAIYGSRGANGVIMITTNKGTKNTNAQLKYNMYVGTKTNFADYPMMNGDQLKKVREISGAYQPVFTNGDEVEGTNTNWQDLLFENGFTTNQELSVTGGTETGAYNMGLSYFKDDATIPTQGFKRYSMHAALDQEIGKNIKIGLSTNTNYSVTNNANLGIGNVLSASPLINPYNADGSLKDVVHMEKDNQWTYTGDRIKGLGDSYKDQTTGFGTYNNFYGEIKCPWVEGLKYRLNLGLNYRHQKSGSHTGTGVFSDSPTSNSSSNNTNATTWNWAIEHMLTYDKTFGDHTINFVALYSAEKSHYDSQNMSGLKIPSDQLLWYNIGQAESTTINPDPRYQGYNESGLESIMGRIMYNYKDKYMASFTLRRDKSSRLGGKAHTYPAVSLGWDIAKEKFMESASWLDQLKLRVGYGETSNESVDPYKTLGLLGTRAYNFGPTGYAMGYYVSELPNPDLDWEFSKTYNFGLDFSFFHGRLSGTAEYYIQKTENLLQKVSLPSTSGVGSVYANVGKTENKGFELSLNGIIIDNKNGWTWEAGLNFYTNVNKITELADRKKRDEGNGWFVGHSINSLYDYEKIGIWQKDEEELRQIMEPGGSMGMIKVKGGYYTKEEEEAGVIPEGKKVGDARAINSYDRQIIELDPSWEGGFNTRIAYKNWDLSAVASFRHGGKLISTLYGSSSYLNMLTGRRNNVDVNYWTENNPTNDYPSPAGPVSNDNPKYGNSLALFSGSYLKFRTITLGYNFKGEWMKKIGLTNLRAYATVTNPFVLFSPYYDESGMDPETNSKGDENQAVNTNYNKRILVVGFNTPTTRNYLFGLNVTF